MKAESEFECEDFLTNEELMIKAIKEFSKQFELSSDQEFYELRIAEADGDPDTDFPKINLSKIVGQLGFTNLSLCGKEGAHLMSKAAKD